MPGLVELGLGLLLPMLLCALLLAGVRSRGEGARAAVAGLAFGLSFAAAFAAFYRDRKSVV